MADEPDPVGGDAFTDADSYTFAGWRPFQTVAAAGCSRYAVMANQRDLSMQESRELLKWRLLKTKEVDEALRTFEDVSVYGGTESSARRGIRILTEEPGQYNKWLYTLPEPDGTHRLVGLSRRFCPFTNRHYVGGSLYHRGLASEEQLVPTLTGIAQKVVRRGANRSVPVVFRGLVEQITPEQIDLLRDWREVQPWTLMERKWSLADVIAERKRVRWDDERGPVWTSDGGHRVELAKLVDAETIYQFQHCLGQEVNLPDDRFCMRDGIYSVLTYLEGHNFFTYFTLGAFLALKSHLRTIGCLWSYRSFHPARAGWTVWIRRPYVLPQYRRRGLSRALFNAAVGIFAESGYPTQQKLWVLTGAPSETALQGARFQVSKDKARFLAEVTHAEHS